MIYRFEETGWEYVVLVLRNYGLHKTLVIHDDTA